MDGRGRYEKEPRKGDTCVPHFRFVCRPLGLEWVFYGPTALPRQVDAGILVNLKNNGADSSGPARELKKTLARFTGASE